MKKRRPIFAPGWMSMPVWAGVLGHHAYQRHAEVQLVRDTSHRPTDGYAATISA
jgi:hypothetical protein